MWAQSADLHKSSKYCHLELWSYNFSLVGVHGLHRCYCGESEVKVLVAQSRPTLCNPMDYSLPGSSVHGILQARILEWIAIPFSKGSSRPRD